MRENFKFTGLTINNNRPIIPVLFEVPAFHCGRIINFLVDTGSTYSAITEKEANLLGLEFALLPEAKKVAIGFGGTFRNKIINCPVILTFKSPKEEHKITYGGGFQIIGIPSDATEVEREKCLDTVQVYWEWKSLQSSKFMLIKRK